MPHFSDTPIYQIGDYILETSLLYLPLGSRGQDRNRVYWTSSKIPTNVAIIVSKIAIITQVQNRRHQTWFQLNFHDIPTQFPIDFLCSTILVIDELVRFRCFSSPTDINQSRQGGPRGRRRPNLSQMRGLPANGKFIGVHQNWMFSQIGFCWFD